MDLHISLQEINKHEINFDALTKEDRTIVNLSLLCLQNLSLHKSLVYLATSTSVKTHYRIKTLPYCYHAFDWNKLNITRQFCLYNIC